MSDLAELFAKHQTNVIDWHGKTIYSLLELDRVPDHFRVRFVSSKSIPVQGLHIRVRGGVIRVNGRETTDAILWRDTAPEIVDAEVQSIGGGVMSLKIWNVWRGGFGATHAWLGNSAMQLEGSPRDGRFVLRCSDGVGDPNFGDLVAEVIVH